MLSVDAIPAGAGVVELTTYREIKKDGLGASRPAIVTTAILATGPVQNLQGQGGRDPRPVADPACARPRRRAVGNVRDPGLRARGVTRVAWSGIYLVMPRTDAQLLRASHRDPQAFGEFYERHAESLLAFFARRTWDVQEAADLTAETFAAAFAGRRRYRDTGAPAYAWLLGIARHQLGRAARRRRVDDRARRRLGMQRIELDDLSIARIEELAGLDATRAALPAALEHLPTLTARAVALRVTGELSYSEVAERLGCSEGAARVRVKRGLDRLADLLETT